MASTGTTYGGHFENRSPQGAGAWGEATATTGSNVGVMGSTASGSGYGVYYQGGFGGTGKMRAIVRTSKGPTGLGLHTTAGDWVEDFGEERLTDGRCRIELDPLFLETVTIDAEHPLKVFVQLHDESSHGVAVKKGTTGFDVMELENGRSNGTFDYRVVASRRGFEENRLDYCKAAETDSNLYPELREKELRDREEERGRIDEMRRR